MSNIEWTDVTWNPVVGCTPVSPGCLNCYAATMARRLEAMGRPEYAPRIVPASLGTPYDKHEPEQTVRIAEVRGGRAVFTGEVRTLPDRLAEPLHWRKPRRVFVNSMSDLFHEAVPFDFIDRVFAVMALCPKHTFQVLTKRPERMAEYLTRGPVPIKDSRMLTDGEEIVFRWPLPNVWLGTSVENQAAADERIPHLLRCPAAVRFLSVEPLLGEVDLTSGDGGKVSPMRGLHWVVVGGESGPGSRPCDVAWVRSIVRQCESAGVPCFVKQLGARPVETNHGPEMPMRWNPDDGGEAVERWYRPNDRKGGEPAEWPEDLRVREWPKAGGTP